MNNEIVLNANKLNMRFITKHGSIDAIDDLTFSVKRGEFFSIVGPSGCGKSTLMRILAGMLKPTGGEVRLEGKLVDGVSKRTGMVFQQYAAFPWMTVEKNIGYGPKIAKKSEKEVREITKHYIELVGLNGYEKLFPKELSGGMSKRVDIARAYANNPDILLMDEPFGALDDITKKQMQMELLKIWDVENKTVVFITHDLEEAVFLSDRILVLRKPNDDNSSLNFIQEIDFDRPRLPELRAKPEFTKIKSKLAEVMCK